MYAPPPNGYAPPPSNYSQPQYGYGQPNQAPPLNTQQHLANMQASIKAPQQPAQSPPPQAAPVVQLTPEEQAQLAHFRKYAHILPLPMLPSFWVWNNAGAQDDYRKDLMTLVNDTQKPALTASDKIALQAMSAFSGASFLTMDGILNKTAKLGLAMESLGTKLQQIISLERWATPPGAACAPLLVDIWDVRRVSAPTGRGMFSIRVSREAKLKVVDKKVLEKKVKVKKTWDKGTEAPVSSFAVIDSPGVEVKLEKVLTFSRAMGMFESADISGQFRKWMVPSPPK
jgi:hypothetical protein